MITPSLSIDPESRHRLAVGIIGAGRLGSALAGALVASGYADLRIASRDEARATQTATSLGVTACPTHRIVEECALAFLAVPDRAITELAASLPWRAGQCVVHASGALGLDVLASATARGAVAGSLHPLQTFPGPADGARREAARALFDGTTCGVEAAEPLSGLLEALIGDLGGCVVRLEGVDRALYHAAAVLVSNDVIALMAAAARTWTQAGLPEDAARGALAPLLLAAASNVARLPLERALTGPVARGDASTVEDHLNALAGDADLSTIYRALARELLRLDLGHPSEARAALESLLRD